MKWIYILLIGTLLLCSSGIVSAANLTLFTDEDTKRAQKTITDSDVGYVFALMDLVSKYLFIVVPLVVGVMCILYRMMNNAEKHKTMLAALLIILGVMLALQLYYSVIGGMTPDISTIEF